jgi:hypothetical protein
VGMTTRTKTTTITSRMGSSSTMPTTR